MSNCGDCRKCVEELYLADMQRIQRGLSDMSRGEVAMKYNRFIMCPTCGNKRCPKASDHTLDCTGSNEPGQPGSVYQ